MKKLCPKWRKCNEFKSCPFLHQSDIYCPWVSFPCPRKKGDIVKKIGKVQYVLKLRPYDNVWSVS